MYRYEGGNTRFCWLNVANWTETMLPPYVIGHTAHDVTTWQCEYIRIIEREDGRKDSLSCQCTGWLENIRLCCDVVQPNGWGQWLVFSQGVVHTRGCLSVV